MRSWQPVVGTFLGFFIGKYLSIAMFVVPVMFITGINISGGGSIAGTLLSIAVLAIAFVVAAAIWVFINLFVISSWFPKMSVASSVLSAIMILYTALELLFCGILNWLPALPPFWLDL